MRYLLAVLSLVALPAVASARPVIAVVNYPLAWMAEQLAGDDADVLFPVPDGVDPAFWRPGIKDIAAIQSADVIALNGAKFAGWVTKASLPRRRLVDTSKAIADRYIATETVTHSHGEGGEHSHEGVASYLWLDFDLARSQADALANRMIKALPALGPSIEKRRMALLDELDAFDRAAKALAPLPPAIASHPRYQYFARAYGSQIVSLEWEAGAAPTADELAALAAVKAETGAGLFLWEADPGEVAREAVRALGFVDIVFPPLAARPASGDFGLNMRASLEALREVVNR